ncbi:hypothetical protein MBLNU459_g3218t1 [Dothideomycetes sp. NU459]
MPHKHTRKDDNSSHYNLPPDSIAKALPVGKTATIFSDESRKSKRKRSTAPAADSNGYKHDDMPKAFARLIGRQGKKLPNALDNGEPRQKSKKRKRGETEAEKKPATAPKPKHGEKQVEMPKILPGERLADFNARVDQALPIVGLARKGVKERQTKTEKRLQKMYSDWRKEDERIKEKAEEDEELREEEEEERNALYGEESAFPTTNSKGKRKRMIGEERVAKDDPWAELNAKREKPKGLHDVAQAPPEFKVIPKEKFKVRNGAKAEVADVPNASGSLKRREELGAERKSIIEQYRAIMGRSGA